MMALKIVDKDDGFRPFCQSEMRMRFVAALSDLRAKKGNAFDAACKAAEDEMRSSPALEAMFKKLKMLRD